MGVGIVAGVNVEPTEPDYGRVASVLVAVALRIAEREDATVRGDEPC